MLELGFEAEMSSKGSGVVNQKIEKIDRGLSEPNRYTINYLRKKIKMKLTQLKSHFLISTLIVLSLILIGCTGVAAQPASTPTVAPPVKVVISGSGGTATLLKPLAEAFRHQGHSNWSFEFLSGAGTSGGVKGALDGTLDLGAMARPPKDEELAQGLKYIHFATDRVAFVTTQDIAISALTSQQVKDIFAGKITNWAEVGGPDATINLLVRDEDETNTQILRKTLFEETPFPTGAVVFTGEGDLRKALTSSSQAIAYVSYGGLKLEKVPANTVVVDGLDPTDFSRDYPYTKPAGVAYIPANAAKVQPFLDFIVSEEARKLLAEQGTPAPAK
jgi:phosphate transport system substrate-binding protein